MQKLSTVGTRLPLIDGKAKVTGQISYINDIETSRMLHARPVLSSYAHAKILSIDTSEALAVAGVEAVITAEDLPNLAPSSRTRLLLARERVLFVGHPIAFVLASNPDAAIEGAEKVLVDYEELPAVITIDDALAPDSPLIWPMGIPSGADDASAHGAGAGESADTETKSKPSNIAETNEMGRGDVDAAFSQAALVLERVFETPWVHQSSIETQGLVAEPNLLTGGMTLWISTQTPFGMREEVAEILGVPESDVVVHALPVGGAFGGKFGLYEILIALVANKVGKTVKLMLSRGEELLSTNPAPATRIRIKLGVDSDARITALESEIILDSGIYPSWIGGFASFMMGSFYPCPNLRLKAINVLTNKPSNGAYRAPGAISVNFALESLIEEAATQVGVDPIEFRLKNCAKAGDEMSAGTWPEIAMVETLKTAEAHPLWKKRGEKQRGRGIGVSVGGWLGALEPSVAVCKLGRDGILHVQTGSADLTGVQTAFAMLAAEGFGVPADKVRVTYSDTASAPFAGGVGGSKTLYTMGAAVVMAANEAKKQLLEIASDVFEASVDDLEIVEARVQVKGSPDKAKSLAEIASMSYGGKYPPVYAQGRQAVDKQAPGFCCQIAEVDVDEETGEVQVVNLVTIQDVGKAINPLLVEGQMQGGAVQGIGWALYEQMTYDENGQLLSGSWMDYAIPHAAQAGNLESIMIEKASEAGPFGAKGVGEPPVIPTAAAIANAIANATGVRLQQLPMTAPRVLAALQEKS